MTMTASPYVFISYSSKDHHFVERLRAKLQNADIPYWIDREGLHAGTTNWEKAIRVAIKRSHAVVYVVSPNAFNSPIVEGEIAIAQMSGKIIYPVWAFGEEWIECVPMEMIKAQRIDMRHDRDDKLESNFPQLLRALQGAMPEIAYASPPVQPIAPGTTRRSPFKGLRSFKEEDARDFFGRAAAIEELTGLFKARVASNQGRLLAVIGASGSGKSSLVMAGLIPRVKRDANYADWRYFPPFAPGNTPIRALTRSLNRALPEKSFSAIEDDLTRPHGRGLVNIGYALDRHSVLLIDQFEELFMSGVNADERDQFINLIVQAANDADSGITVLLTLRADFYDRPTNYRELGALITRNSYTLLPMSLAELREAVENPTRQADVGLQFEPGLVGEIVFDLRASKERMALAGALPLLQFTLEQLYERRDTSGAVHTLTYAAYEAIGGVSGAISQHAEAAFTVLDEAAQGRLGRVFAHLIHVDERGEPTRARVSLENFTGDGDAMRLIDALTDARLLVTDRTGDVATLEVAHEALLRNWERLIRWIEGVVEKKRLLQKLETDAEFWAKRGKLRDQYRYIHEQEIEVRAIQREWGIILAESVEEFLGSEIERLIGDLDDFYLDPKPGLAIERLSEIGNDAVHALIAVLSFGTEEQQMNAAQILGQIGDTHALEPLKQLYQNYKGWGRIRIGYALGELGDIEVLDDIIDEVIKDSYLDDKAIDALMRLRDVGALDSVLLLLRHPNDEVKARAIDILRYMRDKRAVEPLSVLLTFSGELRVRQGAAVALGEIGDLRAFEPLLQLLSDTDGEMRKIGAYALGYLADSRAVDALSSLLGDPDLEVSRIAAQAIKQITDANKLSHNAD